MRNRYHLKKAENKKEEILNKLKFVKCKIQRTDALWKGLKLLFFSLAVKRF